MQTINISLSEQMKRFVDEQALAKGYSSASAYLCELVRRDHLRHAEWLLAELRRERLELPSAVMTARPVSVDAQPKSAGNTKQRKA
jgi:Arc/MetJ-type ribon-helix-helix transcriptional regulator